MNGTSAAKKASSALPISCRLAGDQRFWESMSHTVLYTVLSVVAPLFLGTIAALVFDSKLPMRGLASRYLRHADDGNTRGDRPCLDDDVPPAAWGAQLPAVARSELARRSGYSTRTR